MGSTPILSRILSTVDYESQDAKDDSEYQVCWSNAMDKGSYKNPSTYKKVEVLLLCWADNSDDMATKDEVKRLKSVFDKRFHYHTHIEYLDTQTAQRLQVQVNTKVAAFVGAHDGPHTLLIVYYAGHGRPGSYYGELEMHGQSSPNDERDDEKKRMDKIVWNKTEDLLRPAEAHILEIFDCCHAGSLGLTRGDKRSFEYLAATGAMAGTPVPGKDSFTSALIGALIYLVEHKAEGRFTTVELLRRIKSDSPDFPVDQFPVLSDREDMGPAGRIMLHPLQFEGPKAPISSYESNRLGEAKRQTVTLHFDFDERPQLDHVETLGLELNKLFERNLLRVNGVRWGGLKQSMAARVVQTLLEGRQRRASSKRERPNVTVDSRMDSPAQFTPEPPPTPSSICQHSPKIEEIVIEQNMAIDPSHLNPPSPLDRDEDSGHQTQGRQKRRKVTVKGRGS